jgi:hypothetical protein
LSGAALEQPSLRELLATVYKGNRMVQELARKMPLRDNAHTPPVDFQGSGTSSRKLHHKGKGRDPSRSQESHNPSIIVGSPSTTPATMDQRSLTAKITNKALLDQFRTRDSWWLVDRANRAIRESVVAGSGDDNGIKALGVVVVSRLKSGDLWIAGAPALQAVVATQQSEPILTGQSGAR